MLVRAALFVMVLASGAQAAPFEHLKADLASCLRFERDGANALRAMPVAAKAERALQRCEAEVDTLERADGRRLRGDGGLSPSTRSVIESVLGRAERGRVSNARF